MANLAASVASIQNDHGLLAKPLHLQRLEKAVGLDPFLDYVQSYFQKPQSSEYGESSGLSFEVDADALRESFKPGIEEMSEQSKLYNFGKVKKNRKWLKALLLSSDSSEDSGDSSETDESVPLTEEDLQDMLRLHKLQKAAQTEYHASPELKQYQYYSTGLLSNYDQFYDHQKASLGAGKKVKTKVTDRKRAKLKKVKSEDEKNSRELHDWSSQGSKKRERSQKCGLDGSKHSRKKSAASHEAVMTMKRKRLWVALCKKEICRAVKQSSTAHKEVLTSARRLAHACQREVRKAALTSQKNMKDVPSRARRLTKEMLLYWKRYEKVEKEHRKKAEKEAQEQMKMDSELREAKRQQRKLNFLITQTELYAHFMSRKLTGLQDAQEQQILSQLNEQKKEIGATSISLVPSLDDDYDFEETKSIAMKNADDAYKTHMSQVAVFDESLPPEVKHLKSNGTNEQFDGNLRLTNPSVKSEEEFPQPEMFVGMLKTYQLKGMNWLYSLYDKGINGILADEMGLGKTVQTIAFLATLVKVQEIWGPFLIIAPASTLHNWQQEFTKFVPKFKVLPYWGNTSDRKILRKFWSQKDLHTEDASFHVLITSYQLVVQDVKYFQRIKWQYMVLDEAQAIKSTSSVRWKILLGFNCRNRLLLTGTPIQNSMAELWALLHFIMPTLFDSHEEFNEWFSKDIESHAENKSVIDEKHLSRLHKILKPFMLRRVKKDVENELSDKIEILMCCQLTQRQKVLYESLKSKISIDDLMQSSSASSVQSQSATSSLLNLVMQFRKVCNHPDLFERREVKHPCYVKMDTYFLPKLIFREGLLYLNNANETRLLLNLFGLFHPEYIHHDLFSASSPDASDICDSMYSFIRFINLSPGELSKIFLSGLLTRWTSAYLTWRAAYRIHHENDWHSSEKSKYLMERSFLLYPLQSVFSLAANPSAFRDLIFTDFTSNVSGFTDHVFHPITDKSDISGKINENILFDTYRNQRSLKCQATSFPPFLIDVTPKAVAAPFSTYSPDSSFRWWNLQCLSVNPDVLKVLLYGCHYTTSNEQPVPEFHSMPLGGLRAVKPPNGWSNISIPDKETLVTDSGKLTVLDSLLNKLKLEGHRVLIYSQMTRMIDLLEEYMWHRKHTYMRLDGSSKISDRRDMVADFQARSDIFVFLLSTRAGGLGINLTAADTVIFYDSDWNPTVDQQAMDRAHRLGQTKQVTVYRLVCKGSIEERILQRAREKSEIQRMVISGGNFKPDTLKPKEVVSLLLDDDELERKFKIRQAERKQQERANQDRKKKLEQFGESKRGGKRKRKEENVTIPASATLSSSQDVDSSHSIDSVPPSPYSEHSLSNLVVPPDDNSSDGLLIVDDASPSSTPLPMGSLFSKLNSERSKTPIGALSQLKKRGTGRSRGRPRGSRGPRGNGRGRGNVLAAAAAEMAGAQAAKSVAFATYGYSLSSPKRTIASTSVHSSNVPRGLRGGLRASSNFVARGLSARGRSSLKDNLKTFPTKTISLGFYVPGPQT